MPGLLIGGALWVTWAWLVRRETHRAAAAQVGAPRCCAAFREAAWALMLPVIILVGLRMGVFTPTEAAVVAAVYALFVSTVDLPRAEAVASCTASSSSAAKTSAVVMFLIAAAMVSAWLITVADLPGKVVDAAAAASWTTRSC